MKLKLDRYGFGYLKLGTGKIFKTHEFDAAVDMSKDGEIVGIELIPSFRPWIKYARRRRNVAVLTTQ